MPNNAHNSHRNDRLDASQSSPGGLPLASHDGYLVGEDGLVDAAIRVFDGPRFQRDDGSVTETQWRCLGAATLHKESARSDTPSVADNAALEAARLHEAITRFGTSLAPYDRALVQATLDLSRSLQRQGDLTGAEQAVAGLLHANAQLGGPSRYILGMLALRHGETLATQGRLKQAGLALTTASSAFLLASGPESTDYIIANTRAAEAWYAAGDYEAAEDRIAELILGEPGLARLASPEQLCALRAIRSGGHAREAARYLVELAPAVDELPALPAASWHHELAMCHWDLGDRKRASASWGRAWSLVSQSGPEVAALSDVILANMGLEGFDARSRAQPTALLKDALRLAELPSTERPLPVLYLTLFANAGHGTDADQRWFVSPEGRSLIAGLAAGAEEYGQMRGPRHPFTAAVFNTVAVAHCFASEWDKAAALIDELLTAKGFGVAGRDLVKASIAYNGFLVNAVLGRIDMAKQMLSQVIEATASSLDHPLRARAARLSRNLADDHSPGSLAPHDATKALVILPLSE
jgi:hypothetical protein